MKGPLNSYWDTLGMIQQVLGFSSDQMAHRLGMTARNFERYKINQGDLSALSIMEFAKELGVGFESIMTGQIDYKCLARNHYLHASELPERYQVGALSRRRTVTGILDSVESLFGFERRALLMRRFQINEAMLTDPDAPINLHLALDIAHYFHGLSGDTRILQLFGEHSVLTNQGGQIGDVMKCSRTPLEAYEILIYYVLNRFVERNYEWRILRVTGKSLRVAGIPVDSLRHEMRENAETHRLGCHIRAGFIAAAPRLADFSTFQVKKLSCVSDGSPWCEFDLALPKLMPHLPVPKSRHEPSLRLA